MTMSKIARPGSFAPTQWTFGASVTVGMPLLLDPFELVLSGAAQRADPIVRDALERSSRIDPVLRIALRGIVDVVADDASPLLHKASAACSRSGRTFPLENRRPGRDRAARRPRGHIRRRCISTSSSARSSWGCSVLISQIDGGGGQKDGWRKVVPL